MVAIGRHARRTATLLALAIVAGEAEAQTDSAAQQQGARAPRPEATRFYDAATPLAVTLVANFGKLRSDRDSQPDWRWGALLHQRADGARDSVPVRLRPRGNWRRKHCRMPPLRVDFARRTSAGTIAEGLTRPKLVNTCREEPRYEEYVLQEYQLYRIYALLTDRSVRARLLRVSYADSGSGKVQSTRWAIMAEDGDAIAGRLGGRSVSHTGLGREDLDPDANALMGLFQLLIANVDWSTPARHNVEVVQDTNGVFIPVAYDFDHAGAIDAHYAAPPPILPIRSVRSRLFRGACLPAVHYERAAALLRERRAAIRALYADEVGRLLRSSTIGRTLDYFDDFYAIIDDPRRLKRDVVDACVKDG